MTTLPGSHHVSVWSFWTAMPSVAERQVEIGAPTVPGIDRVTTSWSACATLATVAALTSSRQRNINDMVVKRKRRVTVDVRTSTDPYGVTVLDGFCVRQAFAAMRSQIRGQRAGPVRMFKGYSEVSAQCALISNARVHPAPGSRAWRVKSRLVSLSTGTCNI